LFLAERGEGEEERENKPNTNMNEILKKNKRIVVLLTNLGIRGKNIGRGKSYRKNTREGRG